MSSIPTIDRGIPAPERGWKRKYPFDRMQIGDSFFVEGKTASQISVLYVYYRPKEFVARSLDGGVRVWRVK